MNHRLAVPERAKRYPLLRHSGRGAGGGFGLGVGRGDMGDDGEVERPCQIGAGS